MKTYHVLYSGSCVAAEAKRVAGGFLLNYPHAELEAPEEPVPYHRLVEDPRGLIQRVPLTGEAHLSDRKKLKSYPRA